MRVKKDKTIILREIANQNWEIGRLGLFCYISGRSPDKSGDLAALRSVYVFTVAVPMMHDAFHLHVFQFTGFHISTLVARGADTQLDPSCVSAPLATNVDLFACFVERLLKSSSISCWTIMTLKPHT